MKKLILLALFAALAMPQAAQADLLVGFETWDTNPNSVGATNNHTSNEVGFSGVSTSQSGSWGRSSTAASTDGTFGTLAGADTTTTFRSGINLNNGTNGAYDFLITNGTADDYQLDFFHFDTGTFRPNGAHEWTVSILSGDLTAQTVLSGSADNITGGVIDWYDYDIGLSGLTGGNVLAAGDSVTFRVDFAGGTGASGHHQYADNFAVSGVVAAPAVVPEPSSLALLGLAGFGMVVRRRRK